MSLLWIVVAIALLVGIGLGVSWCHTKYLARKAKRKAKVNKDDDLQQLGVFVSELQDVTHRLSEFTEYLKRPTSEEERARRK